MIGLCLFAMICLAEAVLVSYHFVMKTQQEASVQLSQYMAYQEARVVLKTEEETAGDVVSYAGDIKLRGDYEIRQPADSGQTRPPEVASEKWVLVDLESNTAISQNEGNSRISPESMTKVLTILVAAEQIQDLDKPFTMTEKILEYCRVKGLSLSGIKAGETVPVRDLFYAAALPSGADAAMALAVCSAGSESSFVGLMNEKLESLGLDETAHMSNSIGLAGKHHYCTLFDMAMILKAAVENDLAREVLSTLEYTTTATPQNPEGIPLTNWFLRKIGESGMTGGTVVAAKNGYGNRSGDCAASYYVSSEGKPCICVTVNALNSWKCVNDHRLLYTLCGA